MNFFVETIYQAADVWGLSNAYLYTRRATGVLAKASRFLNRGLAVMLFALAALMAASAVSSLPDGDWTVTVILISAALMMLSLGLRLLSRRPLAVGQRRAWKMYRQKGETLRYRFDVYQFTMERPGMRSELSYTGILKILEDKERFYLFDSPGTAHILPKRDFHQGTPEEFRAFIANTTGKPVECIQ